MKTTLCIFFVVTGLLSTHADYLDPEKERQIDEIVEAIMDCRDIMGTQLSVVHNGETVFAKGYGLIDTEDQNPVNPQTLYNIASVTKQFTSALLGIVLDENGMTWSTKVRDVLGEDFYFHDGLKTSQATMRDLASHRLGQPRRDFIGFRADTNLRDAAFDNRFVRPLEDFRDSLVYNNQLYDLMAFITEELSGKNWEDIMVERIFLPANMTSSTFIHTIDLTRDDLARPYFIGEFGGPLIRVNDTVNSRFVRFGGAGAIVSNADDMAQWMKLQVNGGRLNGVQVIPENVVNDMQSDFNQWPTVTDLFNKPTIPVTYVSTGYGLGFQTGWYRGYKMISHSGSLFGYNSLVTLLPDIDIGVYNSLNGIDYTSLGRLLLHALVIDIVLGKEPWLNATTVCTFPEPWASFPSTEKWMEIMSSRDDGPGFKSMTPSQQETALPYPSDLSPFTGEFGDFYYGNITVFSDESNTKLYLHYGLFEPWELLSTEVENVFVGQAAPSDWPLSLQAIIFGKSEEGLQQFDLVLASFDPTDPTVFVRDRKQADAPDPPNPNDCS